MAHLPGTEAEYQRAPLSAVELFQEVARRVSDMLQRPVVSYANGREIVIAFGPDEAPGLGFS